MPDLQQFAIAQSGNVNLNAVPKYTITARVVNSSTGALIADFTGANAIPWPQAALALTPTQLDAYVRLQATWLVFVLAGLPPPY